ncbi:MAG: carbonic anhydrase family protein [Pontixanthobacter sp.]
MAAPAFTPLTAKDWHFGDGALPERWSLQNSEYALCDAGLMQSPIDLAYPNATGNIELETNYGTTSAKLKVGDEKLQLDFPSGMGMMSGDMDFGLLQGHFHTPSEHAISGKRYPLVGHFVHATEARRLGVLGVMFEEGAENPALAEVIEALETGDGAELSLDIMDMMPDDIAVYRYMGSLTTPPCSEGVNWHVAKTPVTASAEQIAVISELLGPSARSIQPRGNRLVVGPSE